MPRSAAELRQDLNALEQIEQLLLDMKCHSTQLDVSFDRPPTNGPRSEAEFLVRAREQEEKRILRMTPRKEAVGPLRLELTRLVDGPAKRALHRFLDPSVVHEWRCAVDATVLRSASALLTMCDYACPECCAAATWEIQLAHERCSAAMASANKVNRSPVLYTTEGRLRAPVLKLLADLPGPGEPAQPRSLESIARSAGMNAETVRRLSRPLQDEGLLGLDSNGVWRRLGDPE